MWPRSRLIWVVAFWTALLIIRPWEKMFPWMADLRFELAYSTLALIVLCFSGQFRILPSMQTTGLIVWLLALTLSSALAFDRSTSWEMLYTYLTVFAFYFTLVSAIHTPYQLLFIVACFVVSTGLFLAKSEVEYFFFGGQQSTMGVFRLQGDNGRYQHPNALSALAVMSLPFLLFLWKARGAFTQTWPRFWRKAFTRALVVFFAATVSSIILTNSRTGMVAFGGFVLLIALGNRKPSRVIASLAIGMVLLGAIWILMPESNRHRLETLWAPIEGNLGDESAVLSAEGRKLGFDLGMEMFRRFPATGVGLGNFVYYRKLYLDGGYLVAHDTYAAVLAETGLIGAAAFLFFIAGIFVNARRTNRLAKLVPDPMLDLLAGLAVACRQSVLLLMFLAISGDYQDFSLLYWIPAYCLLARSFATTIVRWLEAETRPDVALHNTSR
ncbi:MAG: O-antigen ligase family protein [Planctomycetia bacterium]|nr:O-antigen ligase family protein [Planctomycetia bacterium]